MWLERVNSKKKRIKTGTAGMVFLYFSRSASGVILDFLSAFLCHDWCFVSRSNILI